MGGIEYDAKSYAEEYLTYKAKNEYEKFLERARNDWKSL